MDPADASGMLVIRGTGDAAEAVLLGAETHVGGAGAEGGVQVGILAESGSPELKLGVWTLSNGTFFVTVEESAAQVLDAAGSVIPQKIPKMLRAGDSIRVGDKLACELVAKADIRSDLRIANLRRARPTAPSTPLASSDLPPTQVCEDSQSSSVDDGPGSTPRVGASLRSVQFQSPDVPPTQVVSEEESVGVPATPLMTPTTQQGDTPLARVPPTERQRTAATPSPMPTPATPFRGDAGTPAQAVPPTERLVVDTEVARAGPRIQARDSLLSAGGFPSTLGEDPGECWSDHSEDLMGNPINSDEEDNDQQETGPALEETGPNAADDASTASESDRRATQAHEAVTQVLAPEDDEDEFQASPSRADGDGSADGPVEAVQDGQAGGPQERSEAAEESTAGREAPATGHETSATAEVAEVKDGKDEDVETKDVVANAQATKDTSADATAGAVKPAPVANEDTAGTEKDAVENIKDAAGVEEGITTVKTSVTEGHAGTKEDGESSAKADTHADDGATHDSEEANQESAEAKKDTDDDVEKSKVDDEEGEEAKGEVVGSAKSGANGNNSPHSHQPESGPEDEDDAVALAATQFDKNDDDEDDDDEEEEVAFATTQHVESDAESDEAENATGSEVDDNSDNGKSDHDVMDGDDSVVEEEDDWGPNTQDTEAMTASKLQEILNKTAIADSEADYAENGKASLKERRQRVRKFFWIQNQVQRLMRMDDLQGMKDAMVQEYGVPSARVARRRIQNKAVDAFAEYLQENYETAREHFKAHKSKAASEGAETGAGRKSAAAAPGTTRSGRKTRAVKSEPSDPSEDKGAPPRTSTRRQRAAARTAQVEAKSTPKSTRGAKRGATSSSTASTKTADRTPVRASGRKRARTPVASARHSSRVKGEPPSSNDGEKDDEGSVGKSKTVHTTGKKTAVEEGKARGGQRGGVKRAASEEEGADEAPPRKAKRAAQSGNSAARSAAPVLPGDVRVQITGIDMDDKAERAQALKYVSALGGTFAESDPAVTLTHLVAGTGEADAKFPTSRKLLECLALCGRASPRIVHYGWLQDSARNRFPAKNTEEYAPSGFNKKLAQNVDLESTLAKRDARSEPLLAGKTMFLTADAAKDFKEMGAMFKNIGLRTTTVSPAKAHFALVGAKEDPAKARGTGKLRGVKIPIRTFTFFTRGLISYELDD